MVAGKRQFRFKHKGCPGPDKPESKGVCRKKAKIAKKGHIFLF
jgi:hypothetical protein